MSKNKAAKTAKKTKRAIKAIAAVCMATATYKQIHAKRLMKKQMLLEEAEEKAQLDRMIAGSDKPDWLTMVKMSKLRIEKQGIRAAVAKMNRGKEAGQHIGAAIGGMGRAVSHAGLQRNMSEAVQGNMGGRYMADIPTAYSAMAMTDFEPDV